MLVHSTKGVLKRRWVETVRHFVNEWARTDPDLNLKEGRKWIDEIHKKELDSLVGTHLKDEDSSDAQSEPLYPPNSPDEGSSDLQTTPTPQTAQKQVQPEDIKIDLFPNLRLPNTKRAAFYPFSFHEPHPPRRRSEEHDSAPTGRQSRIQQIAELLMNLSSSTGAKEVLNEVPLEGRDFEDLIYELELHDRRDISLCALYFQSSQHKELSQQFCSDYFQLLMKKKCPVTHLLQFLQSFEQRQWSLNPQQLHSLGQYMVDQGELGLAIEILRAKDSSKSETALFNRLIEACISKQRCDQAVGLFEEMGRQSVSADVYTYAALMTCCSRQRDHVQLFQLLSEMKQQGVEPDLYIYNLCIRCREQQNDCKRGLELYEEMKTQGVTPNTSTYRYLIQLCGRVGWTAKVMELFEELKKSSQKPTLACMNSLLQAYATSANPEETFSLFEVLRSEDRLLPDALTFRALFRACASLRALPRVIPMLRELKGKGIVVDHVAFTTALHVCASVGDADTALLVLQEMQCAGLKPNLVTRDVLIRVCVQGVTHPASWTLLDEIKRFGFVLDVGDYNAILASCATRGNMDDMVKWKRQMAEDGVEPNAVSYEILITAAGHRRALSLVMDWFSAMKRSSSSSSLAPYNAYMDACTRCLAYNEGLAAFQELTESDSMKPDARSYNAMVNLSVKTGNLTEAHVLKDQMQLLGFNLEPRIHRLLESAQQQQEPARALAASQNLTL